MASRARYFWVMVGLTVGAAGCGLGDERCDELDINSCNAPAPVGQQLRAFREPERTSRPPVSSAVDVRSVVVTAIDDHAEGANGRTGNIWVQQIVTDPEFMGCVPGPQGRVCGMQLFNPTYIPSGSRPLLGDLVNVSGGRYDEFDCTPCGTVFSDGRTLPELSNAAVERIGTTRAPDPVPVTLAQVATGGDAYVGVLVRITDEITTGRPTSRGEVPIGMSINIAGDLSPITNPATGMAIAEGTRLTGLTGIVTYFYGTKILPRSPAELGLPR